MSAIYAYTAPGADYPEFLNVSEVRGERGESTIKITVRGEKSGIGGPSATVSVTLPVMEFARLVGFLKHHFDETVKFNPQ